jgi:hypothetical protein
MTQEYSTETEPTLNPVIHELIREHAAVYASEFNISLDPELLIKRYNPNPLIVHALNIQSPSLARFAYHKIDHVISGLIAVTVFGNHGLQHHSGLHDLSAEEKKKTLSLLETAYAVHDIGLIAMDLKTQSPYKNHEERSVVILGELNNELPIGQQLNLEDITHCNQWILSTKLVKEETGTTQALNESHVNPVISFGENIMVMADFAHLLMSDNTHLRVLGALEREMKANYNGSRKFEVFFKEQDDHVILNILLWMMRNLEMLPVHLREQLPRMQIDRVMRRYPGQNENFMIQISPNGQDGLVSLKVPYGDGFVGKYPLQRPNRDLVGLQAAMTKYGYNDKISSI